MKEKIKLLRLLGYRVSIKNSTISEPWKNLRTGKIEWRNASWSTAKPLSEKTLNFFYNSLTGKK